MIKEIINLSRPNQPLEDGDFVRKVFISGAYEEVVYSIPPEPVDGQELFGKEWRDEQLNQTDILMTVPDYPYKEQLTAYRQALRDWPATEDFPDTRPELVI